MIIDEKNLLIHIESQLDLNMKIIKTLEVLNQRINDLEKSVLMAYKASQN